MDKHEFAEARTFAEQTLAKAEKAVELYKNELRCELLFLEIIGQRRPEEIERWYTNDLKKYIKASRSQVAKSRLIYAYQKLIERNESATRKALAEFNKACLNTPYKGELVLEQELLGIIDELAVSA
jgi:IS1 family transposase